VTKDTNFKHPPGGHGAILAYDSVNDRFQVVHVNAAGQLQVYIAGHYGTLLVQQNMPSLLQPGINTYDGAAWRKQPTIWGYYDRLAEFDTHTKVGAGDALRTLFTVPDGYVYIVNAAMSKNIDKITVQNYLLYDGSDYYSIFSSTPTAVNQWQLNPNLFYALKKDDRLTFQFVACDAGDHLEFGAWGYKMKIDM